MAKKEDTHKVAQLYEHIYNGYLKIEQCEAKEAEMCKYMLNSLLAAKVVFCSYFKLACDSLNIDYETVRQLSLNDNRISPSHTIVYDDALGYDSHCFNKDLPALANMPNINEQFKNYINTIISSNDRLKGLNK